MQNKANDGAFDPTAKLGAQVAQSAVLPGGPKKDDFDPSMQDNEKDMIDNTPKQPEAPQKAAVAPEFTQSPRPVSQNNGINSESLRDAPLAGSTDQTKESLDMKEILARQPKINFYIPLEPGEKAGVDFRAVTINGYRCEVKKGVYVELPQSIANLLMQAYNIENNTFTNHPLNLDRSNQDVKSALQ